MSTPLPSPASSNDNESFELPSQNLRTFLSLALVVYVFALFVSVAKNYEPTSELRRQLVAVPGIADALQLFFIDQPFANTYSLGQEIDRDYKIEIVVDASDDKTGSETLTLPPAGLWPHLRVQRYQDLMFTMAHNDSVEMRENEIPAMVARGALLQAGIDSGRHLFRLVGYGLIPMGTVALGDESQNDPHAESLEIEQYIADVILDQGEVVLNKHAESRLSVPVQ